jgi:hypothetical protein
MGLDMYLLGKKYFFGDWRNTQNNEEEEGFRIREKVYDLGYWRKHYVLNEYIIANFGKEDFNTTREIELSLDIITKIISDINLHKLKPAEQFQDLEIFTRSLFWLDVKEETVYRSIVYQASW